MKSYGHAPDDIYAKATEPTLRMRQRKQKRKKAITALGFVCLLLIVLLSIGCGMSLESTPIIGSNATELLYDTPLHNTENDNTVTDRNSNNNKNGNEVVMPDVASDLMPSMYPTAWKEMNAVIVKWGEQNDQTWVENYGKYSHYDGKNYSIEYVGVNVEFTIVFTETMSESLIPEIEKTIAKTTYLMIPKFYMKEIETGDTSLVFLQQIARYADITPDGAFLGTYTTILGAKVGDCLAEEKFVPAPIFNIKNGIIHIPEQAYETRSENGEYYSYIVSLLQEANEYVLKKDLSTSMAFKDGATVEEISEFFEFICSDLNP